MTNAGVLVLSIAALALAPVFYFVLARHGSAKRFLDGFVLGAVGGIVVLHVLPRVLEGAGPIAAAVFALGLVLPSMLHRLRPSKARVGLVGLGLLGICTHAAIDGAGLVHGDHALSIAIVLHRLPAGVFVWGLLRPIYGARGAIFGLGAIAIATVIGFAFVTEVQGELLLFEALVAGALTHVVIGHAGDEHCGHTSHAELAGTVVGVVLALGLIDPHEAEPLLAYGSRFLHLGLETAPALLIGFTFAGLFVGFLPRGSVRWLERGGRFQQASRGVLFGAPIPICSCGVLPAYEGLVRRGAPAVAAMAFLVATPELGVEAVLLSFPLLGWELTFARVAAAVIIAFVIGVVVGRRVAPPAVPPERLDEATKPFKERLRTMLRFGYGEIVDHTIPWILLGLAVAALFVPDQLGARLAAVPAAAQVVLFALVSIPIYVCASGATPLAAALILAGASSGSAIAFLLAGPATNVTTFGVLSRLHGRGVALGFGALILGLATISGLAVDATLATHIQAPSHEAGHVTFGWVSWASAIVVVALLIGSLLRQGPRHFVTTLLRPHHDHSHHDHDHHGHHHHDHHHHGHHHHAHDHHGHHHDHDVIK